jgi:hypothetical protein
MHDGILVCSRFFTIIHITFANQGITSFGIETLRAAYCSALLADVHWEVLFLDDGLFLLVCLCPVLLGGFSCFVWCFRGISPIEPSLIFSFTGIFPLKPTFFALRFGRTYY